MKNDEEDEDNEVSEKEYIWNWKKEYGKSSIEQLIDDILNSTDFEKRYKAAFILNERKALEKLKGKPAVEKIINWLDFFDNDVLGDFDEYENLVAIWTLAKIKDKRAVKSLIQLLKNKPDDIIGASAWALGEIGDKKAIPALVKAMKYEGDLAGLWDTGGPGSPEDLIEEGDYSINDEAAFVTIFNQIIDETLHYSPIEDALKKLGITDEEYTKLEIDRLKPKKITAFHMKKLIDRLNSKDRVVAIDNLTEICKINEIADDRLFEPLIQNLQNSDHYLVKLTIYALGHYTDREYKAKLVKPLLKLLKNEKQDFVNIVQPTVSALCSIRDPKTIEPIINTILDPSKPYNRTNHGYLDGEIEVIKEDLECFEDPRVKEIIVEFLKTHKLSEKEKEDVSNLLQDL